MKSHYSNGTRVKVIKSGLKNTGKNGKVKSFEFGMYSIKMDDGSFVSVNRDTVKALAELESQKKEKESKKNVYYIYAHDCDENPANLEELFDVKHNWAPDEPSIVIYGDHSDLEREVTEYLKEWQNVFVICNNKMLHTEQKGIELKEV